MGVSSSENAELFTYKLKDISLTLYMQWRDNRPLTGGPMTWEIFNTTFLYLFFPREMRDENVMDFINLRQGGKSVHE